MINNLLLLTYPCYLVKSIYEAKLNMCVCVYIYIRIYFLILRSMGHIHDWLGMSEYSCVRRSKNSSAIFLPLC